MRRNLRRVSGRDRERIGRRSAIAVCLWQQIWRQSRRLEWNDREHNARMHLGFIASLRPLDRNGT
jgi:hypothetical protein